VSDEPWEREPNVVWLSGELRPGSPENDLDRKQDTIDFSDYVPERESELGRIAISRWGGVVGLDLPAGVDRHPRLLEMLRQKFDRSCLLDNRDSGVRISFCAQGSSFDEASSDVDVIAQSVIDLFGLPEAAIVERQVRDRRLVFADQEPSRPLLQVLPDVD